jgi:hypothetical protein
MYRNEMVQKDIELEMVFGRRSPENFEGFFKGIIPSQKINSKQR